MISQNFVPLEYLGVWGSANIAFGGHPEWFTRLERAYLALIKVGSRFARAILVSSRSEESRIQRVWPWTTSKTTVVGYGTALGLVEAVPTRPKVAPSRPFLLCVGRINTRKNLARLIEAFERESALNSKFDLVIVGQPNGMFEVARTQLASIKLSGHLSDAELAWLYTNAKLFVFPSLDESYGLPLMEASGFGTPSAASEIPSFRELDVAAAYFDPLSSSAITQGILRALSLRHPRPPIHSTTLGIGRNANARAH